MLGAKMSFAQASYDTCIRLKDWQYIHPQSAQEAQKIYDSLRLYIEKCATDDNSYEAFLSVDGAVQRYATDTTRFDRYRDWLISVLYLNTTNPAYFCACVGSIAGTYQYGKYNATLAGMAVLKYVRQYHPECWGTNSDKGITKDSIYALEHGLDPTHLPTLEQLGLGFLLTHQAVSPSTALPSIYLASFTSTPNPFKAETTLSFELNRMAYVTVEVFDPLGRKVWGDDHGYSLDKGIHTAHLDGAKLSSGSYYARISTGFGEVKTVKLVKE